MSQLSPTPTKSRALLSDKTYNILKHVAAIGLPALSALYYTLAQIWNISHPGQIMATIAAVNICIGALLGISTAQYNSSEAKYAGVIEVIETEGKKLFSLNLNSNPEALEQMNEATFKVNTPPAISPSSSTQGNPPTLGA